MTLKSINLSLVTLIPMIAISFSTISCNQKKPRLSEVATNKNLGYVTNLTEVGILQTFLNLNPSLEVSDEELVIGLRHDKALIYIHPRFQRRSKYAGEVTINFSSYISPLFNLDEKENFTVSLTQEKPNFTADFAITEDFSWNKNFRYQNSSSWNNYLNESEIRINEKQDMLSIDFELPKDLNEKNHIIYSFLTEDALLSTIYFELN